MTKDEITTITPQWITVKEELLNDFYDLIEYFTSWQNNPKSLELFHRWINKLKALYMKVRTKIIDSKKFDPLVESMDHLIQTQDNPTYSTIIKLTMDLCEYIERTGITSVETKTEYLHPSQAIKGKFKVF